MLRAAISILLLAIPALVNAQASSADYQADYQRQALAIYRDTIAMRTAEGHGQVPIMAHYLADRFRDAGFEGADIHVLPFEFQDKCEASGEKCRGDQENLRPDLVDSVTHPEQYSHCDERNEGHDQSGFFPWLV